MLHMSSELPRTAVQSSMVMHALRACQLYDTGGPANFCGNADLTVFPTVSRHQELQQLKWQPDLLQTPKLQAFDYRSNGAGCAFSALSDRANRPL